MIIQKSCDSCKHCLHVGDHLWCESPKLAEVLDVSNGKQNKMTPVEGVRDFKHACGHQAKWHEVRK